MHSSSQKDELVYFPTWTAGRHGYADRIRQLFQEYHQKQGLRMTKQRNRILDYLLATDHHVDMDEIYNALKGAGIGRVTVFRALKMLEEAKLIDRVHDSDGRARYEVQHERPHHDHLVCVQCGRIQEIQWPQVERIQDKACKDIGFHPIFHRHEVFGHCKECRKKSGAPQ